MYIYIKLSTQEYPRYEGDIRLEYGEIREDQTGDNFPVPADYALVNYIQPPETTYNQVLELSPQPLFENGVYYTQWIVRDKTAVELSRDAEFIKKMQENTNPPSNIPTNG